MAGSITGRSFTAYSGTFGFHADNFRCLEHSIQKLMAINDSQLTVWLEPGNPGNSDRYSAFRATADRMGTINIGYSMVGTASRLFGWSQVFDIHWSGNPGNSNGYSAF